MTKSKSMRKLLACIVAVMIALAYMPAAAQGAYATNGDYEDTGTGTELDPFVISDAADLAQLEQDINSGDLKTAGMYFELDSGFDLNSVDEIIGQDYAWAGIGTAANPFQGHFDGMGYELTGLEKSLFGSVRGAYIANFTVKGTVSDSAAIVREVLGAAGEVSGVTTIKGVGNNAAVTLESTSAQAGVAGIVALIDANADVTIDECFNTGALSGPGNIGGIAGRNSGSLTVVSSYNTGNISFTRNNPYIGGICGNPGTSNTAECAIDNCYNTGTATPNSNNYHPIAKDYQGDLETTDCYWIAQQGVVGGYSETDFANGKVLGMIDGPDVITWVQGDASPILAWEETDIDKVKLYAAGKIEDYADPDDYGEAQQEALADAIEAGWADLEDAEDLEAINAVIADAVEAINDIPTSEEIDKAIEDINYYASEVKGWYREAQWDEVQAVIAIAEEAFNASTTNQELTEAYEDAVDAIDAIPTDEEMTEAEEAKGILRQAVIYAKNILGAGEYTAGTVTDVNDALDYADEIMKEEEAFAWEVEDAINAVYDALYDLVPIDKNAEKEAEEIEKELKERIHAVETLINKLIDIYTNVDEADYTPESYAPLQEAINAAEELLNASYLPDIVDYEIATANLLFAQKDLVKKPVNVAELKDQLGQKVIDAKRDIASGDYTEDSVANLTKAIDDAKAIIANVEATEADVIEAYTDLMIAWYDLEPTDKAAEKEIDDFIAAYAALLEKLIDVKNIKKADYTAGTYANLKAAVDEANALLEDPLATSNDLTAAKIDILLAQKDLKKKSANTMKVKTKKKTVKYTAVKSKKKVVKAITVTKAKGKVTYAKTAGSAKLTVNKKNGKITVKKGTKKGKYKAKVKVKAAGNNNYKAKTKTVQVVIVVK